MSDAASAPVAATPLQRLRRFALPAGTIIAFFLFQPYTFLDWSSFRDGVQYQADLASGATQAFYTIKWHGTAALSCNRQQHGLDRRFKEIRLMSLQPLYRPLRPDLDKFLYAAVGEEQEAVTLTMISALT